MSVTLALIVEPDELAGSLGTPNLLVVDLCKAESYAAGHVPGAVHLEYSSLVTSRKPVGGLLPEPGQLSRVLSAVGLTPEHHVVAYDDEGGGKAGRLLWTLDVLGHRQASMLDGGLGAWSGAGHRLQSEPVTAKPSHYEARILGDVSVDKDYILSRLGDNRVALVDARTLEEYEGSNVRAERGGHIPGAVNFNWVNAMDEARERRLKPAEQLRALFEALGVTPDKEVIAYCHTHHRSSHTYVVLKSLGYANVKGYPGSWSEWGNLADVPVEK